MKRTTVATIDGGMRGLAAAAALRQTGIDVTVYEQARQFARVGAGIQTGCNAMHVLRGLAWSRPCGRRPSIRVPETTATGAAMFDMVFGPSAEEKYGAPCLLAHRGDLHAALVGIVPAGPVHLDHRLVGLGRSADGLRLRLRIANGRTAEADVVFGADGVNSVVRSEMFGAEEARFTGRIAYRTVYPAEGGADAVAVAAGEAARQNRGILDRHRRALRPVGRHAVAGIAQQRDIALDPAGARAPPIPTGSTATMPGPRRSPRPARAGSNDLTLIQLSQ
ncbi:hypothetical protein BH11PSE3_BH11PSE3_08450 [soil metagenome]